MKYIVSPGEPLRVGGVFYQPGAVVEIMGVAQRQFYGDRLIQITNPELIRVVSVNAHPCFVTVRFQWGRHWYEPGDIYFAPMRATARMVEQWTRHATAEEVAAFVHQRQGGVVKPEAPATTQAEPPKATETPPRETKPARGKSAAA